MADRKKKKITVDWEDLSRSVDGLEADADITIAVRREVIPVVFVAGFGGSRLQTASGRKVWDPDDPLFMLLSYGLFWSTPSARKALLVGKRHRPGRLRAMDQGDHAEQHEKERGGPVATSSYGDLIGTLERHAWPDAVKLRFQLPVHAFGYDWTGDIRRSGDDLSRYIEGVIGHHAGRGRRCRQVVLITHSTGGLVARWACCRAGAADRVLGVIHGAQPVHGTPLTYWVMKAGFRQPSLQDHGDAVGRARDPLGAVAGAASVFFSPYILGSTGRHTTATLGNMPGALQLLPSERYRTGAGRADWLRLSGLEDGKPTPGAAGSAYDEIYLEREGFWRLATGERLEPLPGVSGRSRSQAVGDLRQNIEGARAFHGALGEEQHPHTYHLHGAGKRYATPDEVRFDVGPTARARRGKKITRVAVDADSDEGQRLLRGAWGAGGRAVPSFHRGGYAAEVDAGGGTFLHATLRNPEGEGDGTIPVSSGAALAGCPGTRGAAPFADVDHQPFFSNRYGAVQDSVIAHVEDLCAAKIEGEGR